MSVRLNLLPAEYRRTRLRRRRFRTMLTVATLLLVAEIGIGLFYHVQAQQARRIVTETRALRAEIDRLNAELARPVRQAAQLRQEVNLARGLRTTHPWSRLLALIAEQAPERMVLTHLATTPGRWTPALQPRTVRAGPDRNGEEPEGPRLLDGVTIRGYAADHHDLSTFMIRLQDADAFRTIDLKDVRRERHLERDAVLFELQCRW